MRKINGFFFGSEKICISDALWFYGSMTIATIITLSIIIMVGV